MELGRLSLPMPWRVSAVFSPQKVGQIGTSDILEIWQLSSANYINSAR
jgi:hypothetical protein